MRFSKELIKGSTKNLILAVLSDDEMYGYQIVKSILARSGDELAFGEGTIYPALHSLEKAGMLKSHWVEQQSGPNRKYYTLTKKGRKQLTTAKQEWQDFSGAVNKVLDTYAH
jgi:PadR family transcriptional regulator PadR